MSANLTQEQKANIRKNLPLKIFERREEAAEIESALNYSKRVLFNLMRIEIKPGYGQHIKFSGTSYWDKSVSAYSNVGSETFRRFRDDFADIIRQDIKRRKKQLEEIPNAKIIPFNFRKKEVEADRRPIPNPPPKKKEPQTILTSGAEIAKAAGIHYAEIKPFAEEKGLPAFKISGRKFWYAFPEEIEKWKKGQEGGNHAD